jgi:hypothetical protein
MALICREAIDRQQGTTRRQPDEASTAGRQTGTRDHQPYQQRTPAMIRTRIAQAAAVATFALGTVVLLPSAAVAAAPAATPAAQAGVTTVTGTPATGAVAPSDMSWG